MAHPRLTPILLVLALAFAACSGGDVVEGDSVGSDGTGGSPGSGVEADAEAPPSLPPRTEITIGSGTVVELGLETGQLAVVIDEGGRCSDGTCLRVLELGVDGSWLLTDSGGTEQAGTYDAAELLELSRSVDPAAVVLGPFTGLCPTAFDGVERSYLVFSADEPDTTVVELASCRDQLDAEAPILVTLDLLITDAGSA